MIVDVHTHVWDSPDQMGPGTARRLSMTMDELDVSPMAYDEAMEPVTHSFILGFHSRYLDASVPHEVVADHVARNPKKYMGFAGIDPMDREFIDSLNKAQDLGLVGVMVSPGAQGFHPSHTRAMRMYDECQQRGLPVMVHPGTHLDTATIMEYSRPHLYDAVGREFPDLRLVLAQVGHPWAEQSLWLIGKHANFYADLSDLTQRPWQLYNVLLLAQQQNVTDHLLLGSDFPFSNPHDAIMTIYSVNHHTQGTQLPTIPREDLRQIVERDVLSCLGLSQADRETAPLFTQSRPAPAPQAKKAADEPASDEKAEGKPTPPTQATEPAAQ